MPLPALFRTLLRRQLMRCAVVLVWMLAPLAQAGTQTSLTLHDDMRVADLWPFLTMLEDPSAAMTIEQVVPSADRSAPISSPYANLGVRRGAIWLRMPVEVPAGESGRWLIDVDYASIDEVDVYVLTAGQVAQHVRLGDTLPFAQRPLPTRSHAAHLNFERAGMHELLFRVQSTSAMILPIRLYQADAYYSKEASTQALQAVLAGIWVSLCLYSLTQWLVLRNAMFGYYAATIFSTGLYFASYFGMGQQHVWGGSDWLNQNMPPLTVLVSLATGLMFVSRALDVPQMSRRAQQLVRVLATAAAVSALGLTLGWLPYRRAHDVATVLALSPMLVAVPVAYLRWRAGDRPAAYMLWGWLIYAIGAGHQALLLRGALDVSFWTQHALQLASTVEMTLWMMLLGARMGEIRSSAELARRERDRLHSLAYTDALTGLLNRRGLQSALDDGSLGDAAPLNATAVYLLDLDGFKPVNDRLGHDAGDQLLRQVGERLKAQLRAGDLVARLGGDEFVIAAAGLATESHADAIGRKLLQAFQEPFEVADQACRVGLTIGYAIAPHDGTDLASLLKRADAAMYVGKQSGKNCLKRGGASVGMAAA